MPQRPSPKRSFAGLEGHEYIHENGQWRRCQDAEEFANYIEKENRRRSWFVDKTTRKGQPVEMLRRVKAALEILTVTFAPWLSDWTAVQLTAKKDPRARLAAVRTKWLTETQGIFSGEQYVLGYPRHHCPLSTPSGTTAQRRRAALVLTYTADPACAFAYIRQMGRTGKARSQ